MAALGNRAVVVSFARRFGIGRVFGLVSAFQSECPFMPEAHQRITLDPAVLTGKPVVRGTRLSVDFIIGLMADGWSEAAILGNYPGMTREDIAACLAYARDVVKSEKVYPSAA